MAAKGKGTGRGRGKEREDIQLLKGRLEGKGDEKAVRVCD